MSTNSLTSTSSDNVRPGVAIPSISLIWETLYLGTWIVGRSPLDLFGAVTSLVALMLDSTKVPHVQTALST